MDSEHRATFFGLVCAMGNIGLVSLLPKPRGFELLTIQFAAIAAVYLGSALLSDQKIDLIIEIAGITVFLLFTLLGLWVNPSFLIVGYFLHGVWDLIHHPEGIRTKVVHWWPPFCVTYDWIIAGFICVHTR